MAGLIGKKIGMTQAFDEDGRAYAVTVIQAGPCTVVQVKAQAVQLGFGAKKDARAGKAELGHARKAGLEAAPAVIREFALAGDAPAAGAEVKVDIFAPGERVKITGTTKGRGFQGMVHRYGAGGGPASHGIAMDRDHRDRGGWGRAQRAPGPGPGAGGSLRSTPATPDLGLPPAGGVRSRGRVAGARRDGGGHPRGVFMQTDLDR